MEAKPAIIVEEDQITIIDPEQVIQDAKDKASKPGRKPDSLRLAQGKRAIKPRKGWWPEEVKIQAATLYQAGMTSVAEISKLTGVPAETLKQWRYQDWWVDLLDKINNVSDQDTVSKLNKNIDIALEQVQDRLLNGELIADPKTGTIYRKPVSLRDATISTAVMVDKRQLLRGKPTSRVEKVEIDQRLAKLAEEFTKFLGAKDVTPEADYVETEECSDGDGSSPVTET